MELFFSLLSLAALAGFAVLLVRRGRLAAPLAPFTALCGTMIWFSLGGMLGVLRAAGWAYFILAAAVWATCLVVRPDEEARAALRAPGFAAFWVLAAGILVFFAVKNPMFITWDEFSFWGTAAKIVKYSDGLYVNASIGWDWVGTHRPALIVLGYFFQFFGGYAEWRVLAGYDILMLSIFAVLTAGIKPGEHRRTVPALLFGALLPFAVMLYGSVHLETDLYVSSLADVPLGLTFGGVLALYYMDEKRALWPAAAAAAALALEKDTGFALGLVAVGIIAVDALLGAVRTRTVPKTLAKAAGMAVGCGAAFWVWQVYLSAASRADTSNVGGTEEMGMVQMVLTGLKELLGIGRTEKFARIMGNMVGTLLRVKNTMLGPGIVVVALILLMAAGAAVFTREPGLRVQAAVFALLGLAGFAAYFCFIGFTYVYVFTEAVSDTLVCFERYLYPYLLGWLLAAGALVLRAGWNARWPGLLHTGFLAATLALGALIWLRVPLSLTVFGTGEGFYADRRETQALARQVQQAVPQDAHIFFISQGDDGNRWFLYTYELYPWYLDYSGTPGRGGGGTFALPGALPEDTLYYRSYTAAELMACMRENGCDYVFVEQSDTLFVDGYAALFSDGLAGCRDKAALYVYNEEQAQYDFLCNVEAGA